MCRSANDAAFLAGVAQDDLCAAWWLVALRGLRRGELAGLRWTDVDLQAAELTVAQQETPWQDPGYVFTTADGEPLRPGLPHRPVPPAGSAGWWQPPDSRRSGCTIYAKAPPRWRWPRIPI